METSKTSASVLIVVAIIGALASIGAAVITSKAAGTAGESAEKAKSFARPNLPLGTVISSPFSETKFKQINNEPAAFDPTKSRWSLADGRDVPGSNYSEEMNNDKVPDLRGLFLRGLNSGRKDEWADYEDRAAFDFQIDSTKLPNSGFQTNESGNHGHTGTVGVGPGEHANGPHPGPAGGVAHIGNAGNHYHEIEGGDNETRPKNAAVYFYILINQ